ncbi:FAR1-RELATED SEQUENCE 5-like protein [Drosera capensis]
MDDDVLDFAAPADDTIEIDCASIDHNLEIPTICADVPVVYVPQCEAELEPFVGMEFESEEGAKAFYNSYARRVGFSTRVSSSRRSRKDGAIIQRSFVCCKEGFRNMNEKRYKEKEVKRPRMVTRVGCKATMSVKMKGEVDGRWVVTGFVREHNHDLVPPDQVHSLRSHRQISGAAKTLIDTLQAGGLGPRRIMSALVKEYGGISKVGFTLVDCRNYIRNIKHKNMEGDIEMLVDYLRQKGDDDPNFFYTVQRNEDNTTGNVVWADGMARMNYSCFGDTITFDTTYRSNRYKLPFVPFTGVNHHGQPVLFGCVYLVNETEEGFVWLFKAWLGAMSGKHPVSITTDHDDIMRSAITQVFPETRHRFCKCHIFKQCQEQLSLVLLQFPSFEADFHKCVNLPESIAEFETCWLSLLDRYALRDNNWLQSLYYARKQWVPIYLRDSFFAEMSSAQHSDSINSYFDGYVNASTTLGQFFKLYEKALESRNEKEVKADYDTMNTAPLLKTPSPMEKQASGLYTRKIFTMFQEELVGTLIFMATKTDDDGEVTTFHIAKYGEEHKSYYVRFNVLEKKASCSCQMFEFSGLLCRHVLAVFRATNILTLPMPYILKRWTRNAKSSVVLDHHPGDMVTGYLESHTVRYTALSHEALKFVKEGAKTAETFDVAMAALQDAFTEVLHATKNDKRRCTVNDHARANFRQGSSSVSNACNEIQGSTSEQSSEDDMDQQIRGLTNELELARRTCDTYRANLFQVLKEIEDHKQQFSVKTKLAVIFLPNVH